MADIVQQRMEEMVPELLDLEKKQIFSKKEIRSIVKKRKDFEYQLQSGQSKKEDYLRYIKYEITLEVLRKTRSKKMGWRTRTISDFGGLRRISAIFNNAIGRHKGDLAFWYQYIDFLLQSGQSKNLMGQLYKALRLHPKEATFWLLTADRELKLGHLQSARTLLQRALRLIPGSLKIWEQYLRLECIAAYRMADSRFGTDNAQKVPVAVCIVIFRNAMKKLGDSESRNLMALKALELQEQLASTSAAAMLAHLDTFRALVLKEMEQLGADASQAVRERLLAEKLAKGAAPAQLLEGCDADGKLAVVKFLLKMPESPEIRKVVEMVAEEKEIAEHPDLLALLLPAVSPSTHSRLVSLARRSFPNSGNSELIWAGFRQRAEQEKEASVSSRELVQAANASPAKVECQPYLTAFLAVEGESDEALSRAMTAIALKTDEPRRFAKHAALAFPQAAELALARLKGSKEETAVNVALGYLDAAIRIAPSKAAFKTGCDLCKFASPLDEASWWAQYHAHAREAQRRQEMFDAAHDVAWRAEKAVRDPQLFAELIAIE